MIEARPGQLEQVYVDQLPTGLVGTLQFSLLGVNDTVALAATADAIIEVAAGRYAAAFAVPATEGDYFARWINGAVAYDDNEVLHVSRQVPAKLDATVLGEVFTGDGVSVLSWQRGVRCVCFTDDTKQPRWSAHPPAGCRCGGYGVNYDPAVPVLGLFRSQSRFNSYRSQGEFDHGEASLTVPMMPLKLGGVIYPAWKPHYTDRRVRDRLTVLPAVDDLAEGRVFYPAAKPVPFIVGGVQYAWRVQLQALSQNNRVVPQP